jgi:hypothetical protein
MKEFMGAEGGECASSLAVGGTENTERRAHVWWDVVNTTEMVGVAEMVVEKSERDVRASSRDDCPSPLRVHWCWRLSRRLVRRARSEQDRHRKWTVKVREDAQREREEDKGRVFVVRHLTLASAGLL